MVRLHLLRWIGGAALTASLLLAPGAGAQPSLTSAGQQPLMVVGWNVESGGAAQQAVARRIRDYRGVDLWGLSEVSGDADAAAFEAAAEDGEGGDFMRITGTTGGEDRLAILYNARRFERVRHEELTAINPGGRVRAPLVAHFRERATGRELLFMVNHLYRGDEAARHRQAQQLNAWARRQTLPVIAVGDYNFDWEVSGGDRRHDRGYDNLTAGGAFTWVRPARLVKTNCDRQYDTVLDFVFVSQAASTWRASSEIDVAPGDCPDGATRPDHRPVRAVFTFTGRGPIPQAPGDQPTREELLRRIEALEAELRELREMVERMPRQR